MTEGLRHKEKALQDILNISENQRVVIESELPFEETRDLIFQMNNEKQASIDIVKACDNMFEEMLKDMGAELEARQGEFKPQVKIMQEHIRRIMDTDVKIRLVEDENNKLLDIKRGEVPLPTSTPVPKTPVITNHTRVLEAYKEGKKFKG